MTMGKSFALALMCVVCLPPLHGQTKSPGASSAEPGILKEYDQAIDQGLHWSTWRREHQADARACHIRRRLRLQTMQI